VDRQVRQTQVWFEEHSTSDRPSTQGHSGLRFKGGEVPGSPRISSFFAKGKLSLMVQQTLCRAKITAVEPGWTDTIC